MPSTAAAVIAPKQTAEPVAAAYNPETLEERLLATQIERAWNHLQAMHRLHDQLLERCSLLDLFENDLERFKLLSRTLAEAERMWRHAVSEFWRARRRREKTEKAEAAGKPVHTEQAENTGGALNLEPAAQHRNFRTPQQPHSAEPAAPGPLPLAALERPHRQPAVNGIPASPAAEQAVLHCPAPADRTFSEELS